ncbi:MAG: hypothetical protein QNL24_13695 [Akkermansiaceae bacterium]
MKISTVHSLKISKSQNLRPPSLHPLGQRTTRSQSENCRFRIGDTDNGPTKTFIAENKEELPRRYQLSFGKRPAFDFDAYAYPGSSPT